MLARGGMLLGASETAYGEAITGLVKAAGPAAGLTRLAGDRLEGLSETDDCAHIVLQWEAIAADGKLFTALDADLMLVPAGDQLSALALAGAYRPQPGQAAPSWTEPWCAYAPRRRFAASWPGWRVHSSTRQARQEPPGHSPAQVTGGCRCQEPAPWAGS